AYADCAAFVLPSLLETPGQAALEAAAQGAPLVLTSARSTREHFGDAARYVDPMSTAAIADAIEAALAQPATVRQRRARTSLVRSRFQWATAIRDLLPIYRSLLPRPGRPA